MEPRIVRQWQILRQLEASRLGRTSAELRDALADLGHDRHERTVKRDLEELQEAGFPLDKSDGGRWRLLRGDAATARTLEVSPIEMVALLVAEESVAGSPMETTLHALHQQVRAMLSPGERQFADDLKSRIRASTHGAVELDANDARLRELTRAVNSQRLTRIAYWSPVSGETHRVIEPYLLWHARGGLYIVAHDHKSGQSRTFAVQRVRGVEVLDETFTPDPTFDAAAHTRRGFGVFDGPKYRIEVEFREDIAYIVTERQWHYTQVEEPTEWGVLITWHMAGLVEVARWVAGFGGQARVRGPQELAERVRQIHASAIRAD